VEALEILLIAFVVAGAIPPVVGVYTFALASVHSRCVAREPVAPLFPRVAIVVPAWNEAAVLGRTLDRLAALEYPRQALRVYVVDDASTDGTPALVNGKAAEYPGLISYLRRDQGGQGKAHTINHGLGIIRAEDWYEAVLIIDADVILTVESLRRMTRHFAAADVGAVTAYIKEGSRPENYLNRFIAFEYVTAQAAARRAQNMLGAQACLAGGAQLLSRESLDAVGGRIDTSTLAEDTATTFKVQLAGRRVVFDPTAVVWAEEPSDIGGLWKQRLRWGRGNVQITRAFRHVWFRRRYGRLGGIGFAAIWFTTTMMPVFMVLSSIGLVGLFFADRSLSGHAFRLLLGVNVVTYLFITISAISIDPDTGRRTWREAILFPGVISVLFLIYAVDPPLFKGVHLGAGLITAIVLFAYVWQAGCMLAAGALKALEPVRVVRVVVPPMLYVVGYGPLLAAMTAGSYIKELRGAEMRWEKTEKSGKVGEALQ
jgi:cellulose synthase/poly-beta-1,6-N-acetylglucosamine synthase-like glycosyltransferase